MRVAPRKASAWVALVAASSSTLASRFGGGRHGGLAALKGAPPYLVVPSRHHWILVAAFLASCSTASSTPPDNVDARSGIRADGCSVNLPAGRCSESQLKLRCLYTEECPLRGATLATCSLPGPDTTGGVYWLSEPADCPSDAGYPDVGTRSDGCPSKQLGEQPCVEPGKTCSYDDFCPSGKRVTIVCTTTASGAKWVGREDSCP